MYGRPCDCTKCAAVASCYASCAPSLANTQLCLLQFADTLLALECRALAEARRVSVDRAWLESLLVEETRARHATYPGQPPYCTASCALRGYTLESLQAGVWCALLGDDMLVEGVHANRRAEHPAVCLGGSRASSAFGVVPVHSSLLLHNMNACSVCHPSHVQWYNASMSVAATPAACLCTAQRTANSTDFWAQAGGHV